VVLIICRNWGGLSKIRTKWLHHMHYRYMRKIKDELHGPQWKRKESNNAYCFDSNHLAMASVSGFARLARIDRGKLVGRCFILCMMWWKDQWWATQIHFGTVAWYNNHSRGQSFITLLCPDPSRCLDALCHCKCEIDIVWPAWETFPDPANPTVITCNFPEAWDVEIVCQ